MSDPSLVQITFKIKPEMPKDMKKLILACFTDYYTKYYPNKIKDDDIRELGEKYPAIYDLERNDAYHNVNFQVCQLSKYDVYDLDTNELLEQRGWFEDENGNKIEEDNPLPDIGISILSLPRRPETVDDFFKLVGPYIVSLVQTIGICHHYDYGKTVSYYYFDRKGNIRKHMIKIDDSDEILYDDKGKTIEERREYIKFNIENAFKLGNISENDRDVLLNQIDSYLLYDDEDLEVEEYDEK